MKFLLIAGFADSLINFRGPFIRALQKSGFEVHVAAPDLPAESTLRMQLEAMGLGVHEIHLHRTGKSSVADIRTLLSVWRLIRKIRPSHVMGYTIKPVIYGTLAAWLAGVPYRFAMITGLGYAFQGDTDRSLLRALVVPMYAAALRRVQKVFFQNRDDEALFRELNILSPETPTVVVNGSGVDLSHFRPVPLPTEGPTFLLIARLLGDKGIREYAQAAKNLRSRFSHCQFALVGWLDGNPGAVRKTELDEWISEDILKYWGRMDDVRPAIANCSVYVLPSYREGTPRTVLEAMAMGRPIITTDAPGCRETVVDGENGFLVPVKAVNELAEAMQRFIEAPGLIQNMGRRSREMAEAKYDVDQVNAVMLREIRASERPRLLISATVPETFATILNGQPKVLAQQFQICLLTSPGDMLARVLLQEGVRIRKLPMSRGITLIRDILAVLRMIYILRKEKPSLVHSYTPKAGLVTMLAAWVCRIPLRVHTFTGLIFPTSQGARQRLLIWMDRLICACATHIVPEGVGVKGDLERFKITGKPLRVIGYGNIAGVDTGHFSPSVTAVRSAAAALRDRLGIGAQEFVFCFVGRLNRDKGLTELTKSFANLQHPAHLILVGAMDDTAPLSSDLLAEIDTLPRLHKLGFVDDIRPALAASDVLVLPSYREGFPNVVLQAGAMALPVIATDINGANEVIESGLNGWLVPPRDVYALLHAMSEAMRTPQAALRQMGERGRRRIQERFEQKEHWSRLIKFYEELLSYRTL